MARSVSSNLSATKPTTRSTFSNTVGPSAKPPARPIAAPRSRVASAGFSKSVGPGAKTPYKPAAGRLAPVSRPDSQSESRPTSREGPPKAAPKTKRPAWDTKGRLEDMELAYQELKETLGSTTSEKNNMNELLASERARRTSE
jgi:kinesin family protein C1